MSNRAPTVLKNLSGQIIQDDKLRLQLQCIVGFGGYGVVYRAFDTRSPPTAPRYFAVKCLLKPLAGDKRREYFQRNEIEIHRLASSSGHPGVVKLHRVIEDKHHRIYVVMDYCPDGDLFTQIVDRERYMGNDTLIKNIFIQVLDVVEHLQRMRIYHRDIKPENFICINGGTKVLITDFGLATRRSVTDEIGCGSTIYMSPETLGVFRPMISHSPGLSDIWALGVLLINLICARNPWQRADPDPRADSVFHEFAHNPDYLGLILPISKEINSVLKHIFKLNPLERITISKLREEILKVERFTKTPEEEYLALKVLRGETINGVPVAHPFGFSISSTSTSVSSSGSEETIVAIPIISRPRCRYTSEERFDLPPSVFDSDEDERAALAELDSDDDDEDFNSSSDSDSGSSTGPITPEMLAFDEANVLDDVDEELELDTCVSFGSHSSWGGSTKVPTATGKRPVSPGSQSSSTRGSRTRKVLQRSCQQEADEVRHDIREVMAGGAPKAFLAAALKELKATTSMNLNHRLKD